MIAIDRRNPIRLRWAAHDYAEVEVDGQPVAGIFIGRQHVKDLRSPKGRTAKAAEISLIIQENEPAAARKIAHTIRFLMSKPVIEAFRKKRVWGFIVLSRNPIILRQIVKRYPFSLLSAEFTPQALLLRAMGNIRAPKKFLSKPFVNLSLSFAYWRQWSQLSESERRERTKMRRELLERNIEYSVPPDIDRLSKRMFERRVARNIRIKNSRKIKNRTAETRRRRY